MPTDMNRNWFVPGDDIDRHVIATDISRYLGSDATARPGQNEGTIGYWVNASRNLTSAMIADLQADSARWREWQGLDPLARGVQSTSMIREANSDRLLVGRSREAQLIENDAGLQATTAEDHKPRNPDHGIVTEPFDDASTTADSHIRSHLQHHSSAREPPRAENHLRSTTDAFKQFANNEKLRLRAEQEARRSNQLHEQNIKLNDLKEFAANFKLNSPVREDLVPILVKDRYKSQHHSNDQHVHEQFSSSDRPTDKEHSPEEICVDTPSLVDPKLNAVRDLENAMNATDSGYGTHQGGSNIDEHSIMGDDTDSVATDENQVPIPGHDKYLLEEAFASEILKRLSPRMQEQFLLRGNLVTELLYNFSIMVGKRAASVAQGGAASFVRRVRNRIVAHVRKGLQPDAEDDKPRSVDVMHLAEKMERLGIDPTIEYPSTSHMPQPESEGIQRDEEDEDEHLSVPVEYAGLRSFLLEGNEFEELLHGLELGLQAGGAVDTWSQVRLSIAKELAPLPKFLANFSMRYFLDIDLPWSPRSFLREQYKHLSGIPDLGSVITLSGAMGHVYAATAGDYIRTTWPRYGQFVLSAVQNALDSEKNVHRTRLYHFALELCFFKRRTQFTAIGPPLFISSATEILIWLSTSCRASTEPNQKQACRMHLGKAVRRGNDLAFKAELEIVKDIETDDPLHATCWHGMFRNPVIAHNYPTPHRTSQEMGLELSLDLMLALARTFWAAIYDGVLLLKGFNTMLTPTLKTGDSIIWHLTVDRSGGRLSYNAGLGSSCIHSIGEAIFDGARHFVGWIKSADFLVGSQQADYDNINFSGGAQASAGLRAEAAVNFTAGKYLTLSSKVSRGIKDTPECLPSDDYVQDMEAAARISVVMSDATTRQHWLADGVSVVLHLARAWLAKPHASYAPTDSSRKLWCPGTSGSPSTSLATLASMDNRELGLYVSQSKRLSKPVAGGRGEEIVVERQWFLLQDLAHRFAKWIEQIHDRANKARHSSDVDLTRQGNKVIGFEFLDLLRGTGRVEPCLLELGSGAEAWLPYTRSIDTVHILGSGFGDLIKVDATTNELSLECGQHSATPRHTYYLIAPLSVLKVNMERLQHTDTCAQLACGLYWWETDEAFQNCQCQRAKASARCTSLVRKLHGKCLERPSTQASGPTSLPKAFERYPTGAIIIGYEPQLLVKDAPTTDSLATRPPDQSARQQSGASRNARGKKQSPSDSGYASNVGSSSRGSQSSSLVSEDPVPEEFRIRGAAGDMGGRKLTKRRKTER